MKLLNAVNLILPKVGERAVTSLEVKHPTLAVLLPIVDNTRKDLLLKQWWFNTGRYEAFPDADGHIVLGTTTIQFIPDVPDTAVLADGQLYNPGTGSPVFTTKVAGEITRDVEFDRLPESAAQVVWNTALVEMYATDIGMSQELQLWLAKAKDAHDTLMSEHLRQRKHNTKASRPYRQLRRAMYS